MGKSANDIYSNVTGSINQSLLFLIESSSYPDKTRFVLSALEPQS